MKYEIRQETIADIDGIARVNCEAFEEDSEAELVDLLRMQRHIALSLVAESNGQIVGHILFSHIAIVNEQRSIPALALAPMAVLPTHQNQGIGSALLRASLEHCRAQGHAIVIVVGHPEFYPRFGFSARLASALESVYAGDSFMALELVHGALAGVTGRVVYSAPFDTF